MDGMIKHTLTYLFYIIQLMFSYVACVTNHPNKQMK